MKTLHIYLTRQVIVTLLMTVTVFTFVLLLGNGLKEIAALLVNGQATFMGVMEAFGLLIPFVLVFALPMGMLTATLLVFGRFSADNELTAVRASGVSLMSLITPVLVLSLLLCGLSAYINMEIAPRSRAAYVRLRNAMGLKVISTFIPEGRLVKNYAPYSFYVGNNDGVFLHDVYVSHVDKDNVPDMIIRADNGRVDTTNQELLITLFNANQVERMENGTQSSGQRGKIVLTVDLAETNKTPQESSTSLSDMTFGQLQNELKLAETAFTTPPQPGMGADQIKRQQERMTASAVSRIMVEMHREVAISFACFGFALVGIPLAIRTHRRETNMGILFALILAFIYYAFLVTGESLSGHPNLAPYLILWIPNFIFQAVGSVMLWRANKGI